MSLLSKAALFALKEIARPLLRSVGTNVGIALGKRAARKIDPESFHRDDEDDDEEFFDDEGDEDEEDEDDGPVSPHEWELVYREPGPSEFEVHRCGRCGLYRSSEWGTVPTFEPTTADPSQCAGAPESVETKPEPTT